MPIIERSIDGCFEVFQDHMRELVAATVTATYPLIPLRTEDKLILSFRQQDEVAIPIDTKFGRLFFYLGQALKAVPQDDGCFRLETRQYWYRLQHEPSLKADASLRWEYDKSIGSDSHCRHHAQMPLKLGLGDGSLDLNKAHLPTGWVTIEEVIRFLIKDLEVEPPCGADQWASLLAGSERKFFEDFTSKRYTEPGKSDA